MWLISYGGHGTGINIHGYVSITLEIAIDVLKSLLGRQNFKFKLVYESMGSTLLPHMKESFFFLVY